MPVEPVRREHVCAEMTGQNNAAFPFGNRSVQVFPAGDAKHSFSPAIRYAVQEHVAGPPEYLVAAQLAARGGDIPIAT